MSFWLLFFLYLLLFIIYLRWKPKRGRAAGVAEAGIENPFATDEKPKTSMADRGLFERGFTACITASEAAEVDVEAALNGLTIPQLTQIVAYYKTKATAEVKLRFIAEKMTIGPSISDVKVRVDAAMERHKTSCGTALWNMSVSDGAFNVEVVRTKVQSILDFKKGIEAANAMNP